MKSLGLYKLSFSPGYLLLIRERIEASYTITSNNCWEWTKGRTAFGYGKIGLKQNGVHHTLIAHRVYYELVKGLIPEGLVLDHFICSNPPCINPDHLKPVTHWENTLRSDNVMARNARATRCINGHEFNAENTIRYLSRGTPARACRKCKLRSYRKRYAQKTLENHAKGLGAKGKPLSDGWKKKYGLL